MNIKSLKFHIESQDYFGTLSTVLSLLYEGKFNNKEDKIFKNKINELIYLQNKYKIIRK